jgi:hypothetical protein
MEDDNALADDPQLIERAVLEVVVDLHPDHLAVPELVLRMAADDDHSEDEEIREAIRELRRAGLFRYIDGVVAPTHTALHATELLIGL